MPTPGETERLAAVRAFAEAEVAPAAGGWSGAAEPAPTLWRGAAALGLFGVEVPEADGGLGRGFGLRAAVCEALAAADFGFAMAVVNTHNVALRLSELASPALKARHLPELLSGEVMACTALTERGGGSDAGALETAARRLAGGGWSLSGEKTWIVNARRAGLAIVYAQTGARGARDGIAAFLVPLDGPGCRRYPVAHGPGDASMGTGGFVLEDCRVPEDHLLIPPGGAFRAIMTEINGARAYVAAMCCGMLDRSLAVAAAYGAARQSFGRPLAGHQAWRFALARAETDLAAARALTAQAVAAVADGLDAQLLAAQAKIAATETCQRQIPALLHAMGAEGLRPEHPFVRHLVAAQTAALVDGATEMLLERVARLARPYPQPD